VSKLPADFVAAIRASGKDIYDEISRTDRDLWLASGMLEAILEQGLCGLSLAGLPLRTRSKVVKTGVCEALGYPAPRSFKRSKPRFPGQDFDVFIQKSNNLQVWNEAISPSRRYAIIRVAADDEITRVKVVDGLVLARLDTTGAITTKYQARVDTGCETHVLTTRLDTAALQPYLGPGRKVGKLANPGDDPKVGALLPIADIFQSLSRLVGMTFDDPGADQERNRGAALHQMVCKTLGYTRYGDNGQFPNVRHQLLEIKLQTSPTIDLGLILPNSIEPLAVASLGDTPRHCDTRYAIFCAQTDGAQVTLTHLFVTTGEGFFQQFRRFEGKVKNGKLQIPLPGSFFER
jgi:hypothetical protein